MGRGLVPQEARRTWAGVGWALLGTPGRQREEQVTASGHDWSRRDVRSSGRVDERPGPGRERET